MKVHPQAKGIPFWIAALATGAVAVGYARLIEIAGRLPKRLLDEHPMSMLLVTPLAFLAGAWLVRRFAPEAAGSGIPQVMAAHELDHGDDNAAHIGRLLGFRMSCVKVLSSTVCILGGGAIGREGPTIQLAAAIFHAVGKRFQKFWPQLSHRTWIAAGGAAGLAAAFNTPLGGIVYAIEEMSSASFGQLRTLLFTSVIIAGVTAQWIAGPYLYFGYPALNPVSLATVPLALLIGAACGFLGGMFGWMLAGCVAIRSSLRGWKSHLGLTIATGVVFAVLALLIGPTVQGSGAGLVSTLLAKRDVGTHWSWVIGRYFGSVLSYFSGCAGGIFAPSLSIGGVVGSEIGKLFGTHHPNLVILLGMIGFLSGVTRAPFTAFVLVLEMTDRHSAIFPMMLSSLAAISAAKVWGHHSFYEIAKHRYIPASRTGP